MLPVDVNATFNVLGDIKPIYVRLEDESHALQTHKIQGIEYSKLEKLSTILFVCYIVVEDNQKQLKLSYNLTSHKWVLL